MKLESLLKGFLCLLSVALILVISSWIASEISNARAEGGGGSSSGEWILVTANFPVSNTEAGNGNVLYMFNTDKQVLLVYSYNNGWRTTGQNRYMNSDLVFLAGRHCRWDLLYSQLSPYPYGPTEKPPTGIRVPSEIKSAFERLSAEPVKP